MKIKVQFHILRVFLLVLFFSVSGVSGQTFTATYGFASSTIISGPTDPTPVPTSTKLDFGSFVNSSSINANAATRFSFVDWPTGATNNLNTFTGAININRHYSVTLTPTLGNSIDLSSVTFTLQRSGTGIRQYVVRSSVDNFNTNLPASVSPANTNLSVVSGNIFQVLDSNTSANNGSTITLGSAFSNITTPITFRFYGFNSEANTGSFSIDNVAFSGTGSEITATLTTAWSNLTGPTATIDCILKAPFITNLTNQFSSKNLTIDTGGTLTINPGNNITVTGAINNTLTADKLVVESNANLIQTNDAVNTGNITVKRNTNIKRLDYTYWSSPVVGQTLAALSPATLPNRFYGLDNANTFVSVASSTTMVSPIGYSVRAPDNFTTTPAQFTATFVGVPNNGQKDISVVNSSTIYRFLGNPYPSTINANVFLAQNQGSLYFWTHSVYQAGVSNYATYTTIGGIAAVAATTNPSLGGAPNGTIQVGQGFMFLSDGSDDILVFNNGMRVANNVDQFYKTSQNNSSNKLWLNLTNSSDFSQILVGYLPNATNNFDPSIDAKQINTGNILYSIIDNNELSIQGRPIFSNNDEVKLGFKATASGNQTITLDHTEGVFLNGQNIYLKDNLTNVVHNLSNGGYNFATETGTFNNRFTIIYSTSLSNQSVVFDASSVVVFNNETTLNVNCGNINIKSIKVLDLQGRTIIEKDNINSNAISIDNSMIKNQVGIVQITSTNNEIVSKKVVF